MNGQKITVLLLLVSMMACIQPPDYPLEPVIEFKSLSRTSIVQSNLNKDSLMITISFTDGDGDIGSEDNAPEVYIKDSRTGFFSPPPSSIPFVPEQGAGNGISGEIYVPIFSACCIHPVTNFICMPFDDYPVDKLVYEIYIVDRAGNQSNTVTTDTIYIKCE